MRCTAVHAGASAEQFPVQEYFQELAALCTRVVTGNPEVGPGRADLTSTERPTAEALAEPSGQTWLGMISDFISNGSVRP